MAFRSALVLFLPCFLLAIGVGCGGGDNAAARVLKNPELPTDKQTKCHVAKSQSEPLIVEWPDAARGRLESIRRRGLVAVRYEGCELEVLPRCRVKGGGYDYSPITRKHSRVTIRDEDDLYASLPVGAVKLEGKLKSAGQLAVDMTIVGRYEAAATRVASDELEGECAEATHVIAALTVGSFQFFAGADAEVGGGATMGTSGAGGKSLAARETLQRDGDETACARATAADKGPPEGCGALLQIEVMPLRKDGKVVAVLPPPASTTPTPAPPPTATPSPIEVPPPYVPPAGPASDAIDRPNPLRLVMAYGALGFGLVGLTTGYLAISQAAKAKEECDDSARTCGASYAGKRDSAIALGVVADASYGIAAVAAVIALLLPVRVVDVQVAPTSHGAAGSVGGHF